MEIKKDPKVNLESRKTTYLMSGLVASLAILFVGLEWASTERRISHLTAWEGNIEEDEDIIATVQQTTPPPPPPPPAPEVFNNIEVKDNDEEIEEVEIQSVDAIDIDIPIFDLGLDSGPTDVEEADGQEIFQLVEQQPEFPGGEEALMKFIKKTLKYPALAAEYNIQGRVTLAFVVEKDGSIGGIEVMRSPADELSKEAIRVVNCMPKWKAGKQRGKPVRVRFVLPITFRLA